MFSLIIYNMFMVYVYTYSSNGSLYLSEPSTAIQNHKLYIPMHISVACKFVYSMYNEDGFFRLFWINMDKL